MWCGIISMYFCYLIHSTSTFQLKLNFGRFKNNSKTKTDQMEWVAVVLMIIYCSKLYWTVIWDFSVFILWPLGYVYAPKHTNEREQWFWDNILFESILIWNQYDWLTAHWQLVSFSHFVICLLLLISITIIQIKITVSFILIVWVCLLADIHGL